MKLTTSVMVLCGLLAASIPVSAQTPSDASANNVPAIEQQVQQLVDALQQIAFERLQGPRGRGGQRPAPAPRPTTSGPEYTEAFSRTVRLGNNGAFDLANVAGDVTITGGGGDDVRIQATKRVHDSNEAAARALLRNIEIRVVERNGLVEVNTDMPQGRNVAAAVDYTIALPSGARVGVRTVSGNIRISNVKGELRAESVSGDVSAAAVGQLRTLKSVSGDIELTDVSGDDVAANTVSGDVTARNLKARSLDLESVSGDMRFTDADCDRISLRTINGDIDYAGRLSRSGRYELQSHSGDVRVTPSGSVAFDLEASTFSGDVRSDYALTGRGGAQGRGNAFAGGGGPRLNRTVRGSFGEGGAQVTIRSFSGDIVIVKR
jgi:DUF4097 and DUF4098 domain-containing protein YvlB